MAVQAIAVADYQHIRVEPSTGSIGAEVVNLDVRDVDDDIIAELRDAWLRHKVLFFRDQDLTPSQHIEYGRAFGEPVVHPFLPGPDGHRELVVLESTPDSFESASFWHSDVTFSPRPPLGSILLGRVLPPYGGDTMWANMELAYDLLPEDTKALIDGATAIHSFAKTFSPLMSQADRDAKRAEHPDQTHPVVRTHPETGAKSLFINQSFTLRLNIDGLDPAEERALRHRLYRQARIPELQCRFRWRQGSIAQWDNRCTQHYAVPDYAGFPRRMERVTLAGTVPV